MNHGELDGHLKGGLRGAEGAEGGHPRPFSRETARYDACGAEFERSGRGRPRKFCSSCSTSSVSSARWRAEHPELVEARNEARRRPKVVLTCSECGVSFVGRPGRVVCSRRCKDARFARLHPEAFKVKRRRHDARVADRRRRELLRALRRELRELRVGELRRRFKERGS